MNKNVNINEVKEEKKKATTWKQDVEIAGNQFLYPWKDITALLGAISIPYINKGLANLSAIQSANNFYESSLKMLQLENTPILKYLSANGILTGISYFLLLYGLSKPYMLNSKVKDCKDLEITDNHTKNGNTIIPIRDVKSFKNPSVRKLICYSNGVLEKDFKEDNKLERLSKKWNKFVIDVEDYKKNKLIIYYKKYHSNKMLFWKNEFLDINKAEYVLGVNDINRLEKVNLDVCPHLLISSSSGGGKTTLFKNLMLQGLLKNEQVVIIDMKFGLDFNKGWKDVCRVITDIPELWKYLKGDLEKEIMRRVELFNKYNCESFKEYNEKVEKGEIEEERLQRIIIGLDEAAQLFIKSKDTETQLELNEIKELIDKIASLYRSVGCSLVTSTQVPSADILSSAVRYNSVLKICGRANELLSKMTIDTPLASQIKTKERGRFVTNEGKFFQGYLFYEKDVFPELRENKEN